MKGHPSFKSTFLKNDLTKGHPSFKTAFFFNDPMILLRSLSQDLHVVQHNSTKQIDNFTKKTVPPTVPTSQTLLPASLPTAVPKTHSALWPHPQRSTRGDVRQVTYLDFHEVSHRLERPSSQITGGIPDDTAKVPHALRHGIPCTHID